jgi:hypothetical protein
LYNQRVLRVARLSLGESVGIAHPSALPNDSIRGLIRCRVGERYSLYGGEEAALQDGARPETILSRQW